MSKLILGSGSPRRRLLLSMLGVPFETRDTAVDEDTITTPDPLENVVGRAELKAQSLLPKLADDTILITADTTVELDGQLLNKPADAREARQMLNSLSGCVHRVHTGTVIYHGRRQRQALTHTADVHMRPYTASEIEAYIETGDPFDKAGAYAIQHPTFQPVSKITGCYLGVVGLSLCQLWPVLQAMGLPLQLQFEQLYAAHNPFQPCPLLKSLQPKIQHTYL